VEVLVSVTEVCSFIMLLAGNLVGFARICGYLWDISEPSAVWVGAVVIWAYTESGGLFAVVCTAVFQSTIAWTGLLVMVYWFIANEDTQAPPPSIGFPGAFAENGFVGDLIDRASHHPSDIPAQFDLTQNDFFPASDLLIGYIYPDNATCEMYNGTACVYAVGQCCYNTEQWCPGFSRGEPCERYDRGAYPFGDQRQYAGQMTDPYALDPFPNAILWNWATIIILGLGNLAALDFQARCMASKTARNARIGCIIGGIITFFVGIPFSYLGGLTRYVL